jgi:hypothetical protein
MPRALQYNDFLKGKRLFENHMGHVTNSLFSRLISLPIGRLIIKNRFGHKYSFLQVTRINRLML